MRHVLLLGFIVAATACGSSKTFPSLCANQVPPPAACATACNATPGAPNSCPTGYHCSGDAKCDTECTATGGQCGDGYSCTADGRCVMGNGGCTGIQCNITDCESKGMQPTTLTGTVLAPNGTLPLYGISVYVPNSDPGPLKPGVQCGSCSSGLPGDPLVQAVTDEAGKFTLRNVPEGDNIPLVITTGKWRRQIKIPKVAGCATQAVPATDTTLPKSHDDMTANTTSVDMPQIAISTGSADSLECLVRRLGIADKEITTDKETGRIHLFADIGAGGGTGTTIFDASFAGGSRSFSDSQTLWGSTTAGKLNQYDIVILSCEGAQHAETKPQQAMDHLKAYADLGGRVFLSHWHNIWIEGSTTGANQNGAKPAIWSAPSFVQWSNNNDTGPGTDSIDENNNPKGSAFATWMLNVGGSMPNMRDSIPILSGTGKDTCVAVDNNNVEQWVYWQKDATTRLTQNFQFTTPQEKMVADRCGKVVFSDMHVSGGPAVDANKKILPYPQSCGTATDLSAQEKALAFMFFDISSCVGVLF